MEQSWWIILIGTVIAMIASFAAYFCGCCKKLTRDELIGLSGIVKITNPDSLQNHNGPVALSITRTPSEEYVPLSSIPSSNASTKRLNGINQNAGNLGTATRSLPEIPVDAVNSSTIDRNNDVSNNFPVYNSGDTNSDLYATLEEHKAGTTSARLKILQNSTATTYEQIDEGSIYNKIKREHPYAQVDDNGNAAGTSMIDDSVSNARNSNVIDESIAIPAASAIAGSVAASHELPYMTPPILLDHFVDDSHDSAKGYTSITVREPLCHIRPQKPTNNDATDSHYTVLSDDSDEMYAAIQEAYTSGSETYAQIQPIAPPGTYEIVPEVLNETTSQRFSVASLHSRQASTSSVASSMTARNSPKEKRQANSPLPKPPDISPDDMYAKVLKKRKGENDKCSSRDSIYAAEPESASSLTFQPGTLNVADVKVLDEEQNFYKNNEVDEVDGYSCGYEILPERNYEQLNEVIQSAGYETVKEADSNPGYESLPEPDSLTPGYERIREPANYERLKYDSKEDESDPNYEELKPQPSEQFHCYATINKSNKTKFSENVSEPDYASLTRQRDSEFHEDSFYERIRNRNNSGNTEENEKCNDKNNNQSNELQKNDIPSPGHSNSMTNLNDLYSKVQKNVKR